MSNVYSQKYLINYYDVDLELKAKVISLLRFCENNAVMQSENLGVGIDYYKKNQVLWVLHKWDVKIYKYPKFKDEIVVNTKPNSFKGFYAYRYFEILNDKKEMIVEAHTEWLFIDAVKKRPIKIIEEMFNKYGLTEKDNLPLEMRPVQVPGTTDYEKSFSVRNSDIDTNNHVNNVQYIAWALEVVPQEIVKNYEITDLKVVYKKEADSQGIIHSKLEIIDEENSKRCVHLISDQEKEVCQIETIWKPTERS